MVHERIIQAWKSGYFIDMYEGSVLDLLTKSKLFKGSIHSHAFVELGVFNSSKSMYFFFRTTGKYGGRLSSGGRAVVL